MAIDALTRIEFIERFNEIMRHHGQNCDDPTHPLWQAERFMADENWYEDEQPKCQWFVCVKPIDFSHDSGTSKSEYWMWVTETLTGYTACFSSDDREDEEWWGFTDKKDLTMWMLRWAT